MKKYNYLGGFVGAVLGAATYFLGLDIGWVILLTINLIGVGLFIGKKD
jgi:hypothetical protein